MVKTLIIGGTGAQGIPIIKELTKDGKYQVRALTRDPESQRAKDLQQQYGVELVKGDVFSDEDLKKAFEGIEAVFVNTDTFTLGEKNELYIGIRIFELAVHANTVKQFIWSTLPYLIKEDGYNDRYDAAHYSTKARVAAFIAGQPGGDKSYPGLKYSFLSTCPYMEQLQDLMLPKLRDGVYSFELPIKNGHVPLIALDDCGKFVRYQFDHFDDFVGKTLEASSDHVGLQYLVDTFTKVTGKPAQAKTITSNEYFAAFPDDMPVGHMEPNGRTWKVSFGHWWQIYEDDKAVKDYKYLDTIVPDRFSLEKWMRAVNYDGDSRKTHLKLVEDQPWAKKR